MAVEAIPINRGCSILSIEYAGNHFSIDLRTENGEAVSSRYSALVIATGLRYRGKEVLETVPGLNQIDTSNIVYGPYSFLDLESLYGKTVLIVGCGDNAFENAYFLLEAGAKIALICRSTPRTQVRLRDSVQRFSSGWSIYTHASIERFQIADDCIEVSISSESGSETLRVHKIHVLAGYIPNTSFLKGVLGSLFDRFTFDPAGYLKVDDWGRTGVPAIYAAGDVCNPDFPNVASAIASGAKAAKALEVDFRIAP
jgi:thioredoxin reductase